MFGTEDELIQINGVELSVMQAGLKHERSMVMVHGLGYDKESSSQRSSIPMQGSTT